MDTANTFSRDIIYSGKSANHISKIESPLEFHPIRKEDMERIMPYLENTDWRTTDFSYAGILMWVDVFHYQYCIYGDTLFIKGVVEDDFSKVAFSVPVGELPLKESVDLLRKYCCINGLPLEFSAVPERMVDEFKMLNPLRVEPLDDWSDYLYDAEALATLKGKKLSKKRNHVNRFRADNPEYSLQSLSAENAEEAMAFMDIFDLEGDSTPMAVTERKMTRRLIEIFAEGDTSMIGAILKTGGETIGFTIGDIIGDTLFIHVEKATRAVAGSYEAINHLFAEKVLSEHPEIKYINREDDAGDEGLRKAKQSYHPIELLKKYNVVF